MDDDAFRLDADLDHELDPAASLAWGRRLAEEPALQAASDARRALRDAVRAEATRHVAPAALRAQLARQAAGGPSGAEVAQRAADAWPTSPEGFAAPAAGTRPAPARIAPLASGGSGPRPRRSARVGLAWWSAAVGGLLAGGLAGALGMWLLVMAPGARLPAAGPQVAATADAAAEAVSAHTRAELVGQPFEVASSDQHTVRPWLAARLNFVPPVVDLAPQGYALAGARRDVIAGETVATLVYRHGAHWISAYVVPTRTGLAETAPVRRVVRGFNVVEMSHAGLDWRLVSDMNPAELDELARLLLRTG